MRTIAVVNQKGGCGKTTTAINLSAYLAQNNKKTLLIDLDPQSNASIGLNINVEELEKSVYDVFSESNRKSLEDVIVAIDRNFDIAPSQLILSTVEPKLAGKPDRDCILVKCIQDINKHYDYIIVDCPPSLGLLTCNGLRSCGEALIPIEMSVFSLQGVARLLEIIRILKETYGHDMKIKVLNTICNPRTSFAKELLNNIERHFGDNVYKTIIHSTVRLKEAAGYGISINKYDKTCRGAENYKELAEEVIADETRVGRIKTFFPLDPQLTEEGVRFRYSDTAAKYM